MPLAAPFCKNRESLQETPVGRGGLLWRGRRGGLLPGAAGALAARLGGSYGPCVHIALIAMSGVRVVSPELRELGLTLPGFAERLRQIDSMPTLALLTLAGMTPERFDVSYHEVRDVERLADLPECDLAAISSLTAQAKEAYALAMRFRGAGVKTVLGGLHATVLPQEAERHVDAVVVGEGEPSWPQVLVDAERGRLKRRYFAGGAGFDLGNAPMPRFDLLEPERYNRITVQTTRGCPWRCEFCASSILLVRGYRVKPVERVLAELRAARRIWRHPFFEFADDNTFVNKRHAKMLMRALAEEGGLRWFTETDISVADDAELLALMREAGCAQVLIGLESPTAAPLAALELRRDWKRRRFEGYREAIDRIQAHGISVNGCFVLGLDAATTDDFRAVAQFVEESGLHDVQITVQTPFPGTPLYARLAREGRLLDPTSWERCTLFDVNFRPNGMSVEELEAGIADLSRRLYSHGAKARRARLFREARRATRSRPSSPAATVARPPALPAFDGTRG